MTSADLESPRRAELNWALVTEANHGVWFHAYQTIWQLRTEVWHVIPVRDWLLTGWKYLFVGWRWSFSWDRGFVLTLLSEGLKGCKHSQHLNRDTWALSPCPLSLRCFFAVFLLLITPFAPNTASWQIYRKCWLSNLTGAFIYSYLFKHTAGLLWGWILININCSIERTPLSTRSSLMVWIWCRHIRRYTSAQIFTGPFNL